MSFMCDVHDVRLLQYVPYMANGLSLHWSNLACSLLVYTTLHCLAVSVSSVLITIVYRLQLPEQLVHKHLSLTPSARLLHGYPEPVSAPWSCLVRDHAIVHHVWDLRCHPWCQAQAHCMPDAKAWAA